MLRNVLALIVAALLLVSGCTNADSAGQPGPDAEGFGGPGGTGTEMALGNRDPAVESPSATDGSSADPAGSADDSVMPPIATGASREASADASSPTLTIYDTETGERITVQAPESAVVRLAHDASADRYAVAFLVGDGLRIYFPEEDQWQDAPLAIRQSSPSGTGGENGIMTAPQDEAAEWKLPLRLSPHFTGDQWFYLSRNNEIFRLNANTGIAERIWSAPENRAVYGMSASPDGTRLAVLLSRDGLGSEADVVVTDAASGTILHERQGIVHVNKSDGILAHLDVEWSDNETFGFNTNAKVITEGKGTEWKQGWLVLDADGGEAAKLWTIPGGRRFHFATDMSRLAVETVETHDILLLDDSRSGTAIDNVLSVDGQSLPDREPSPESGRRLGTGILLGWMHDRHVVWYQNESLQTIEDFFQ